MNETTASVSGWEDLPPQPWPQGTYGRPEEVADWLTSMTREQLVWLLDKKQADWSIDSDCFVRNHAGVIERLHAERDLIDRDLRDIMAALGIDDYARPYSSHEVVQREVIPAIKRLAAAGNAAEGGTR